MDKYLGVVISIVLFFPAALLLVGCVVIQGRIRSNLALLLTVGQGIAMVGGLLSIGMYTLLLSGLRLTPSVSPLLYIPSVVSATGTCIFAFGFLRLAREMGSSE